MPRHMSTTGKTGRHFRRVSGRARPSTKRRKSLGRIFGPKSQFAGVGRGVPGDPRK